MAKTKDDAPEQEKNEKTNPDVSKEEIKMKRELYERKQELESKEKALEEIKKELDDLKKSSLKQNLPDGNLLESLKSQVEFLSRQVAVKDTGSKLVFRQPTSADLVPVGEEITSTARSVLYVVASYQDYRGIEKLPPHKLIIFTYAASDIRKEGKEDTIKNFSQYTTNLRTEIEYLRNHPHYGIAFSENTNEMMAEDVFETQFKLRAANQLAAMTPEAVYQKADEFKVPNWRNKSAEQLRILVVHAMAKQYKDEKKALDNEIIKRRALGSMVLNEDK